MRCIIIGNGSYDNFFDIKPDDFVICADGGYNYAVKFNITPDCIIGDMDSVKTDISGKETVVYPREKDYTDGELAVRLAIEKGFGNIVLLGMTGSRLDHTIGNIFLLRMICKSGLSGFLADRKNTVYYTDGSISLSSVKGKTISLMPLGGDLLNVSNNGLYYPLRGETLLFGSTRGISNVAVSDDIKISFDSGEAAVIVTSGE